MIKYARYLWYVMRHKWFVFLACRQNGLTWLGILHDWSKLLPSELIPYARHFYGDNLAKEHKDGTSRVPYRDETGYYKPTDTGDAAFDFAWLLHQKRNKHHWQFWILPEDNGGIKVLEMPAKYRNEMICDWKGASKAQGHGGQIIEWWEANNSKMQLHPETRRIIERYVVHLERLLGGLV